MSILGSLFTSGARPCFFIITVSIPSVRIFQIPNRFPCPLGVFYFAFGTAADVSLEGQTLLRFNELVFEAGAATEGYDFVWALHIRNNLFSIVSPLFTLFNYRLKGILLILRRIFIFLEQSLDYAPHSSASGLFLLPVNCSVFAEGFC